MAKRKRKKAKKLKTKQVTTIAVLLAIIAIVIIVIFSTTGITAQFRAPRGVHLRAPVCGNGICEPPKETFTMCPEDCHLGDGVCQPEYGEDNNNAPMDCKCGDFVCASPETPTTCPSDCYECGDGICHPAESVATYPAACIQDCHYLYSDGNCDSDQGESAADSGDCAVCGDGICTFQPIEPGYVEDCPQECPCTDTDGGENIGVKGTCTDFQGATGTDSCITTILPPAGPVIEVKEWYCVTGTMGNIKKGTGSGICTLTTIPCPDQQCIDGACVKIEFPVRPRVPLG